MGNVVSPEKMFRLYDFTAAQNAQVSLAHLKTTGWTTWAIRAAINKYNLSIVDFVVLFSQISDLQ